MLSETRSRLAELRNVAFVSQQPRGLASGVPANQEQSVQVGSYTAGEVRVRVNASQPGLLVLSEMYYPEWHATVNGHNEEIFRTDEALRSVVVPAGQSLVLFTYRPTSVYAGMFVSIATGLVTLMASVFWRVK